MLRWYYSEDASTVLEITDRVRKPEPDGAGGIGVGAHAEEGSGWEGAINVDDEQGDLILLMHRRIYAVQDAAPAGLQVVGNWFISALDVIRGTPPVGASRIWVVQMADENSLLSRRIFVGGSSDRGEETDIERILWALGETELNTLSPDLTYIDQDDPVDMDANDYTGQRPDQVISDCSQASGKNYWVKYEETAAIGGTIVSSSVANPTVITTTTPHGLVSGQQVTIAGHSGSTPTINGIRTVTVTGASTFTIPVNVTVGGTGGTTSTVGRFVLCYFNANTSDLYPSAIELSNVEAEIDDSTVFAISNDAKLNRAGGRSPTSGMFLPFTGGYVYEQNTVVGDTYVYRDVAAPSVNVKTAAKAVPRAQRLLAELDEPDDEVEAEITVDEVHMNDAMHGMSIPLHATHLPNYTEDALTPGYATTAPMRIMRRQVRQVGPKEYGVRLWMTPKGTAVEPFFILYRPQTVDPPLNTTVPIGWICCGNADGISGCPGMSGTYPLQPTVGPLFGTIGALSPSPPGPTNYLGITFTGTGWVSIESAYTAFGAFGGLVCTVEILLNGLVVATGFGVTPTVTFSVDIAHLDVVPGDVLTAQYHTNAPGATGPYIDGVDQVLRVTGGSLFA